MALPISIFVLVLVSALNVYMYAMERHAGRSGARNIAVSVLCMGVAIMDAAIYIVRAIHSIG